MTRTTNGTRRILIGFRLVEALQDVLQGIGAYVKQHQLPWQVHCVDADEFVPNLNRTTTDGAITVINTRARDRLRRVQRSGVPTVNMLHDVHPALPSVLSDDFGLGRLAAQHLLGRGFRQFGFVGINTNWSIPRQHGFVAALAEAGCTCVVCGTSSTVTDYRFMGTARAATLFKRWVAGLPKPTAMLVCSDLIARSLQIGCESAGVRVPDEVAILGVDNIVPTCELAPVPMSSVAQDFPRLGFEAASLLHGMLSGAKPPKKPVIVPPGSVVVRRSTDVLAFDDEHVSAAMRLIHARAADGISMKELMREVPVSRKWLDVRFKSLVGHTPSREIRNLRLAKVRELLLHTDLSIQQISTRCGFSCGENMIRFFRDAYGMPPQLYRTRHGAGRVTR